MAAFVAFLLWGRTLLTLAATVIFQTWLALPRWAKEIILVALALFVVYTYAEHKGAARVQARWDAAIAQAVEQAKQIGSKANADAEASVSPLSPADRAADAAIVPRGEPCRVRDSRDRDCTGR